MELEKMSLDELCKAYEVAKARSDDAYQQFTGAAASRCAALVRKFCQADAEMNEIRKEIKRRRTTDE